MDFFGFINDKLSTTQYHQAIHRTVDHPTIHGLYMWTYEQLINLAPYEWRESNSFSKANLDRNSEFILHKLP